jgi:hypothetical protein
MTTAITIMITTTIMITIMTNITITITTRGSANCYALHKAGSKTPPTRRPDSCLRHVGWGRQEASVVPLAIGGSVMP